MDELFRLMGVFISQPWLALLPGALLLAGAFLVRSKGAGYCAAAWLVYCPYEYGMKLRLLCSGECNIRVDLLLLYPVLALVAALGVVLIVFTALRRFGSSG